MHPQMIQVPIYGTANSGVLAAGTVQVLRVPQAAFGGAITILEAQIGAKSGTVTCNVVDLGTAGTATQASGTVASLALAAAGNVPVGTVLATPYALDPGDYLGVEIGVGTVVYPCWLNITLLPGK